MLSEYAHIMYKVDNLYSPEHESGLVWNDPDINIEWPVKNPVISDKDRNLPTLRELVERGEIF